MDASNIAKVFAPNLLRHEREDAAMFLEETPQASQLLQTLIEDLETLFDVRLLTFSVPLG